MDETPQREPGPETETADADSSLGVVGSQRKAWKTPHLMIAAISESENALVLGSDLAVLS